MTRTIVCLSSQSWDDGMWTNKQHIMSRLAADYHVIYVEYGLSPLPMYLANRWRREPRAMLHPVRVLTNGATPLARPDADVRPGLELFDWYTPLLAGAFPLGHPIRDTALYDIKAAMVARYLKRRGITDAILWVYHPGYGDAVDRIPHRLLVYDCVDDYPTFPAYRDNPGWLAAREERLCRNADLVTCTAPALFESKRGFNPANTYFVHNVGDAEHFKQALAPDIEVPPDVASMRGPVVGFVGAVSDYKLNMGWLVALAEQRPEVNVVVIGPIGSSDAPELRALRTMPNVHLLGRRDYEVLPAYLAAFDVAVIPYHVNAHTESVFPIKFFEFLATGTPVVISALPSLADYYDYVRVARSAEEFVEECAAALIDDDGWAARVELAENHSWAHRIGRIIELIDERW